MDQPAGREGGDSLAESVSQPDRAEAMGRRLDRTAARFGVPAEGRGLILDAFRVAMEPRRARITEDHHPDYLHPARTTLILMDDTREADPVTLAAALFAETRDPSLAAARSRMVEVSPGAASLVAEIPLPDRTDHLLEALLALPAAAARVAAAERLDHARHLHLRDRTEWDHWHRATQAAYVPATRRVEDTLAVRLQWWCDMFARRFMQV